MIVALVRDACPAILGGLFNGSKRFCSSEHFVKDKMILKSCLLDPRLKSFGWRRRNKEVSPIDSSLLAEVKRDLIEEGESLSGEIMCRV